MFNIFNTSNLVRFQGNARSSSFGQARAAIPNNQFQGQFGLRLTF